MKYEKIDKCSMSNGTGCRVVLWCSGCSLHCHNCQNPQTHDFNSGIPFTRDTILEILADLSKPYISGLTFSGGHPLEPENFDTVFSIAKCVKTNLPKKNIWMYTGYTWEHIVQDRELRTILPYIDVLVDGAYIDELRDVTLPWRGSSNQRVIDVKATINSGTPSVPILYCD